MRLKTTLWLLLAMLTLFAARPAVAEPRPRLHKMQGRVLMSLGIIHLIGATIAGAVMLGEQETCHPIDCRNEDIVSPITAFTTVALGGLFTAIGVPLYVSGANGIARETAAAPRPFVTIAF